LDGARPRIWREALAFGRQHVIGVLGLAVLLAAAGTVVYDRLVDEWPVLAGATVGVLATVFLWAVVWLMWVSSGLAQRLQGALADEWTGEALHRLRLRGNWNLVPSVRVGAEVVDFVLVCPAGVVSIEAKWSVQPWVADDVSRAAERAAIAAAAVERVVHATGAELPVRAAIVVWGPAARNLVGRQVPMGRHLVDLVPAQELKGWSRGLRWGEVDRVVSAKVATAVAAVAEEARSADISLQALRPKTGPVLRWLTRPR
jgi:hypothetical protein